MTEATKHLNKLVKEYWIEYRHHTEKFWVNIIYKNKWFYMSYTNRTDWKIDIYKETKNILKKIDLSII